MAQNGHLLLGLQVLAARPGSPSLGLQCPAVVALLLAL